MIDVEQQRQELDQFLPADAQFSQEPFQSRPVELEKPLSNGDQIFPADAILERDLLACLRHLPDCIRLLSTRQGID